MKKLIAILLTIVCATAFAANEIQWGYAPSTSNLYCKIIKASNLTAWNTNTSAYATGISTNWGYNAVSLTENSNLVGIYTATMPTSAEGLYLIQVWSGTAYTTADSYLGGYTLDWGGSSEQLISSIVDASNRVDLGSIYGGSLAGNNATLNLKQLNIQNTNGHAIYATTSYAGGAGLYAEGTGLGGYGIRADGGLGGGGNDFYGRRVGDIVGNVSGSVGSVTEKTGFILASTGLDNISAAEVTGVADTFVKKLLQTWQYDFYKKTSTSSAITTYRADSSTANTTQTISDTGVTKTVGKAQ
jgi:hypothetical protein